LEPDELLQTASAPGGRTVVLEADDALLGAFQTLPFHAGVGVLHAVQVRPDAQGRGLGRLLTVAALHALAQQGFHTVELAVDAANAPAVHLYATLGFVDHRRELTYERPPA
ncbi:MAG: GNAT family N-acetyltransferase, partial [Myxococcales bacterium]|nr:GNAT family N-acetyltransferase [Myxococcales bacterium]